MHSLPLSCAAAAAAQEAFRLPLRVYYEDTDAGGVVYYANYLRFCERARTEWLRALGVEQQRLLTEEAIAFMVRSVQADYLAPARLDDEIEVLSTIENLRRASLVFRQEIVRGDERLFTAAVLVACIDRQRHKPLPIPSRLHALFANQVPA